MKSLAFLVLLGFVVTAIWMASHRAKNGSASELRVTSGAPGHPNPAQPSSGVLESANVVVTPRRDAANSDSEPLRPGLGDEPIDSSPYRVELELLDAESVELLRATDALLDYVRIVRWVPSESQPSRAKLIANALVSAKQRFLLAQPSPTLVDLSQTDRASREEVDRMRAAASNTYLSERFQLLRPLLPELDEASLEARLGR